MANLFEPEFDESSEQPGFSWRRAQLARQAGGERLGASLFALPPGEALYPLHYHLGNEELLIVSTAPPRCGRPTDERVLERGEVVSFPRGEAGAHQIVNRSDAEARILLVSEMNAPEVVIRPESGKLSALGTPPGDRGEESSTRSSSSATRLPSGRARTLPRRRHDASSGSASSAPARWAPASPSSPASAATRPLIQDPDPAGAGGGRRAGRRVARQGRQARDVERRGGRGGRRAPAGGRGRRRARGLRPGDRGRPRGPRAQAAAVRRAGGGLRARRRSSPPTPPRCRSPRSAPRRPHPERVVGMHFFNPPALMKLVEVVATADSSAAALEATTEVGRRMGRTPIRAKDSPGFIANRLARPYSLESLRMLADGVADAATIDRACRLGGGFRMGPFELIDLIGLDVNLSVARSFYAQGGEPARWRPSEIQERMVGEGLRGRKNGRGFYSYEGGGPPPRGRPRARHRGADPRPGRTGEDRPGGGRDRPAPDRPDRQRDDLRPRRAGRLARGHEHGDAARLQLAAGPGRVRRADRRRARRRPARAPRRKPTERPTGRRPACSPRPAASRRSLGA